MREAIVALLLSLTHVVFVLGQDSRAVAEVRVSDIAPLVVLSASDEVVSRGDQMRVWFGTSKNVHVSIFRIDTDGRVRILYPERPWHHNYVQSGRMVEVRNSACGEADCAFAVDDYPGRGYIFAIASKSPFEFDAVSNGDYWDYTNIAHRGRVTGDPFRALMQLMDRVVPHTADNEYSYDVYEYHVEQRFAFPRFLCYECHSFVRYPAWNPYQRECSHYQVVRYDGPAYRSAGGYSATRVVFAKPNQIEPQFIFTDRVEGIPFVSVREGRSAQKTAGPAIEAGASARDVGGIGRVPAPLGRREAVHEDGLRRLIRSRSSSDVSLLSRIRGLNATTRPQPRLIRRSKTKPDTSGTRRKIKPDTSDSWSGWNSPGI